MTPDFTWPELDCLHISHLQELVDMTSMPLLYPRKRSLGEGVYWNQPVGRSVCPQNLVRTTPPTVSVQFT